ncbi:MAG: hypothetical protein M1821_002100 [Bathelium mastoideum]|nr:MAG: hypothetical protein M1821_002100 [Bathelium mastoideum]
MARNFSTASQYSQAGSGGYESDRSSDTTFEEPVIAAQDATVPLMWQQQERLSQKFGNPILQINSPGGPLGGRDHSQDDVQSRASTLAEDDEDYNFPEKTPTAIEHVKGIEPDVEEGASDQEECDGVQEEKEPPAPHIPGPLEQQLAALMAKVVFLERENPTIAVSPEEYHALQERVALLEAEKVQWNSRHEALFTLRDEDVENNIKIRGLLAKERHDHESMRKLRDDDLTNVLALRSKLADASRKLQRMDAPSSPSSAVRGSSSPQERPRSIVMERRDTSNDLFQAARSAALEQRALELEKANEVLSKRVAEVCKTEIASEKAWQRALELEKENRALLKENSDLKRGVVAGEKAWRAVVDGLQERIADVRKTEISGQKAWQRGLALEKEHQKLAKENAEMKRDRVQGDKAWRAVIGGLDEKLRTQLTTMSPQRTGSTLQPIWKQSPEISHPASWRSSVSENSVSTPSPASEQATAPAPIQPSDNISTSVPVNVTTASATNPSSTLLLRQVESVHEENAVLRERMSQRVQKLRGEKDVLQREVHAREDEHAELERKLVRLQKKVDSGCPICGT